MTALVDELKTLQKLSKDINAAIKSSQKAVKENGFFMSEQGGKQTKYASWATALAGIVGAGAAIPAAPIATAVIIGVAVGVAAVGTMIGNMAIEREQIRQEHQAFLKQAKGFTQELQSAYTSTKRAIEQEQRSNTVFSADYVQYQAQKASQQNALGADSQIRQSAGAAPEAKNNSGPRMS